jgi:hypothetical protein
MSTYAKNEKAPVFSNGDIFDQLTGKKSPTLWLGHYTEAEVRRLLEKFGILPALKAKGFHEIIFSIAPVDRFMQALKIFTATSAAENLLAEFQLRETSFSHPCLEAGAPLRVLAIEWLLLQNPKTDFTAERPRLPGQRHPGLGLGKRTVQLLVHLAQQQGLAGVLNFPEFFHNAYLYLEYFCYCNPRFKGLVLALRRDMNELSLAELSWAIYHGCVIDAKSGQTYEWQAEALLLPLEQIKQHFRSADYEQLVYDTMSASKFILDQKKFGKNLLV